MLSEILTIVLSALASVGGVKLLFTKLIDHRLQKELKEFESKLHQTSEEYLGDRAALRQYRFDALKRLYTALSPLQFQLIQASDDFVNRIKLLGTELPQNKITYKGYRGKSTLYRLLRVFGLAELIERQIAAADFAVDPGMMRLIRFKQIAFECMSSRTISIGNPEENWNEQRQHIFSDELAIIGSDMIVSDPSQQRMMRYNEFDQLTIDPAHAARFRAMPQVLYEFTPNKKPLLWVRFVALATLCHSLASQEGPRVGLAPETFDWKELLMACTTDRSDWREGDKRYGQKFVLQNRSAYESMLERISAALPKST